MKALTESLLMVLSVQRRPRPGAIPVGEGVHLLDPLTADLRGEHRTEAVPPKPHRLVADVDAALRQQVLHVSQRQRVFHVHHHHEADHLGRAVAVAEGLIDLAMARR